MQLDLSKRGGVMKKHGIAKLGPLIGELANGKMRNYQYKRKTVPEWAVSPDGYFLLFNVNIVDVNTGEFMEEHGILVIGKG